MSYEQIEGMLSADEACSEFVRYAELIAKGIRNEDSCFIGIQRVGLIALLDLLQAYADQDRK